MNDLVALNEAYDSFRHDPSRMEPRQVIGELTIDAHGHCFLNRKRGSIIIPSSGAVINLRGGRTIEFHAEPDALSVRLEDNAGDLINGEYVPYPKKGVLHVTLTIMDDLDGPILDIR